MLSEKNEDVIIYEISYFVFEIQVLFEKVFLQIRLLVEFISLQSYFDIECLVNFILIDIFIHWTNWLSFFLPIGYIISWVYLLSLIKIGVIIILTQKF